MLGHGDGPIPARVMIVGESWGEQEESQGKPFVGASGAELNRMLHEAGILRSECFVTNLVNARPPGNDLYRWIAKTKKDITPQHVAMRDKYVLPIVADGYRRLLTEIEACQPNLIVTLGNWSMWALTGNFGILKWRGSMQRADLPQKASNFGLAPVLREGAAVCSFCRFPSAECICKVPPPPPKLIPTIHPAAILREWSLRAPSVNDLRRAKRELVTREYEKPEWKFMVRPSFGQVREVFANLMLTAAARGTNNSSLFDLSTTEPLWIDLDIETRAGHIACVGISWSKTEGLCVPFMCVENKEGYWSVEEEAQIVYWFYRLLTHSHARVRWQNGLYDAQYIWRWWHFVPRGGQDTMISQHTAFCALPKGLSFLASMYCDWYVYWKDEGKTWGKDTGEDQLWSYNLQDCIYTRESGEVLQATLESLGLAEVDKVQQALFWPVLDAMKRGVRILKDNRAAMALELEEAISARRAFLYQVLGHEVNIGSPKQMIALFYEDLKQRPVLKRTIHGGNTVYAPTCDDDALTKIGRREPLLRSVCNAIADIRTLEKLLGDFVFMKEDSDGRMRCSFNIAGDAGGKSAPYSYRLSSSKNAFGSGGNLQTIPSEKSKSSGKAAARGSLEFALPNIRRMYGPDPGYTFFDLDLDRADLQVFAWEIEDKLLKDALKIGVDMHLMHVYLLDGHEPPPLEELIETHPRYMDHRGPRKHKREFSKVFCHAVDYYAQDKTLSEHTGWTIHEVSKARKRYLSIHPTIEPYWKRLEEQLTKRHYVENKFGYRWYIFDRLEGVLPEAIAWIPQSTVGNVINRAWINLHNNLPEVQVLLQVHDSLAGQFPTHRRDFIIPKIKEEVKIIVPYKDPLIIPVGIKTSTASWGDCE